MLVFVQTEDGKERVLNLDNVEIEANNIPEDASKKEVIFIKNNGEKIRTVMDEERFQSILHKLKELGMLI